MIRRPLQSAGSHRRRANRKAAELRQGLFIASWLVFAPTVPLHAAETDGAAPQVFASPDAAVAALAEAAKNDDGSGILNILGRNTREWISSGDAVQDRNDLESFVAAYDQRHELATESIDEVLLVIGDDGFPFPFPIVRTPDGWIFDPEQGKEELIDRRIGRNELNTIEVLLAIVDAQYAYATADRDGDEVLEYATKFGSTPGQRDGLYWPTAEGEPLSPLGPLVVEAVAQGYGQEEPKDGAHAYHGYYFKPLARQGPEAPGGAQDYVVNGEAIGGFAVLAYPATYGNSGIMSFMVNQDGVIFEADLGAENDARARAIESFDPGDVWDELSVPELVQASEGADPDG